MDEQNNKGKRKAQWQNDYIARTYDRINLTVPKGRKALLQEAAKAKHGGKVNSLINALIDAELARQGLIPSEPPQSPTGADTTSEGTTPPQEPEPPQERTEATGGWLRETGAGVVGGSVQVAPSPTQPTQKQPSEYTLSDFEAMDDAAFQRFVDMSSSEFGKYLSGISWSDQIRVIGRRERAQNKERQQRQREIEY